MPNHKPTYGSVLIQTSQAGCLWANTELADHARVPRQTVDNLSRGRYAAPREHTARALTRAVRYQLRAEINKRLAEIRELERYGEALWNAHVETYGRMVDDL